MQIITERPEVFSCCEGLYTEAADVVTEKMRNKRVVKRHSEIRVEFVTSVYWRNMKCV